MRVRSVIGLVMLLLPTTTIAEDADESDDSTPSPTITALVGLTTTATDTYLAGGAPDTDYSTATELSVDLSTNGGEDQALLLFPTLPVPDGSQIVLATLRIRSQCRNQV